MDEQTSHHDLWRRSRHDHLCPLCPAATEQLHRWVDVATVSGHGHRRTSRLDRTYQVQLRCVVVAYRHYLLGYQTVRS
jgi:hypothetical protein